MQADTNCRRLRWRRVALLSLIVAFSTVAEYPSAHEIAVENPATEAFEVVSGTLLDIRVEHVPEHRSFAYRLLRLDDGSAISLRGGAAEGLENGARVRLSGRRYGNSLEAMNAEVLSPSSSVSNIFEVEGALAIAHADDFATGKSRYAYEVHDDAGGVTTLDVASLPSELHGGSRVRVSGKRSADGASLDPDTITIESEPAGQSAVQSDLVAKSATTNSVLVILANFNNTAAPSYTQSQALQVMSTNANSVANYYSETSYGGQLLNVTVTSAWVTMNLAATCAYTNISTAANAAALALNPVYNASNYNFVVYLFPTQSCGWAGLAYVGFPHQAFINGTGAFSTQVIAHEMGHNFGLWHAGSLSCGTASIGGSCSVSEYGDPWDTMGNQRAMHFNAMQKSRLGWIPASSVKTHSSGSANYTLSPLETGGAATYAVKIPTANTSRTYWLEFRQPIGFDAPLASYPTNGVQVRVASPFEWLSGADDTEIVDMTPGSAGGFGDSVLVVGQSYLDSTNGVNIIVTGATASAVTVSVSKGGGGATTTALSSSANPSTAGASVTFTATVTGTNPTGTVNFTDGGTSLASCSAIALSGSGNIRTAACTTSALGAGSHSLAASYSGDSTNAASSSAALAQTVNKLTSTTGIATSRTPSVIGTSVTFTATVSGASPTGTVNFKDGSTSIAGCSSAVVSGSGNIRTASCATAALAVGTHSVTAAYSGDASNNGSTSGALSQVVNKATSSAVLSSSLNPSTAGANVTFTATVSGSSPTGTVNFKDGSSSISGCSAVALAGSGNSRTAGCATNALTTGSHSIVASYSGDAANAASTSTTLSQTVNGSVPPAPPASLVNPGFETPTLSAGGYQYNPNASGIGWTFAANSGVQSNGSAWGAAPAPEGVQTAFLQGTGGISQALTLGVGTYTLSFKAAQRGCCVSPFVQPVKVTLDGVQIGGLISPPSKSFTAFSVVLSVAASGTHTIGFAGTDTSDKTTFIDAVTLTSGSLAAVTATITSSLNPSGLNKSVSFTATVSGSNPTGHVVFTAGGSTIAGCGSVALSGTGNSKTALCTTAFGTKGTYAIVATYGGDANNGQATSAPLSQTVKRR